MIKFYQIQYDDDDAGGHQYWPKQEQRLYFIIKNLVVFDVI